MVATKSEREIFMEALAITDQAARGEFLDRICGANSELRARMDDLLRNHENSNSILDRRPQNMVETLAGLAEATDGSPHSPEITLAALAPYLQETDYPGSLGRLSHYELLEVLGQGGYGIVFKAFDTKLSRMVAIKILSPMLASTSPPRRRFLREARAAAAVRHENVVQIYGVEESLLPYLVMEFVSGETLQQRSDRVGPFDPVEVVKLGQQIARGLAAAHEKGLIHRDIKPGNILIDTSVEPCAKLSDFGLARTVDDASLSQSGVIVGTPMYMAPEQVHGHEIDQRADLFSLGSVLYLMSTGRAPFRAPNTLAVLKRVAEDKPRSVMDVIPETPRGLNQLIARLHAKSPDERYRTAKAVEQALDQCLSLPEGSFWWGWTDLSTVKSRGIAAVVALVTTAFVVWVAVGLSPFVQKPVENPEEQTSSPLVASVTPKVPSNPPSELPMTTVPITEQPATDQEVPAKVVQALPYSLRAQ